MIQPGETLAQKHLIHQALERFNNESCGSPKSAAHGNCRRFVSKETLLRLSAQSLCCPDVSHRNPEPSARFENRPQNTHIHTANCDCRNRPRLQQISMRSCSALGWQSPTWSDHIPEPTRVQGLQKTDVSKPSFAGQLLIILHGIFMLEPLNRSACPVQRQPFTRGEPLCFVRKSSFSSSNS